MLVVWAYRYACYHIFSDYPSLSSGADIKTLKNADHGLLFAGFYLLRVVFGGKRPHMVGF
jgi:hypothetical protein